MKSQSNFYVILYLLLDDKLPEAFYLLNNEFKKENFSLIPVTIDQIQLIKSSLIQSKVAIICSSNNLNEIHLYNKKIRPHLKMLLKSSSLIYFKLSSFQILNDEKKFYQFKNFIFKSYPQDLEKITGIICSILRERLSNNDRWTNSI